MKRFRIIFTGTVQGVSFRYYTKQKARELGLKGYVKNLENGNVEVVAEGNKPEIMGLVDYCKSRIPRATVTKADVQEETTTEEFHSFDVRF